MSMTTIGYEELAGVLQDAYDQATKGKGAERHANGNAFEDQRMQTISTLLGTDRGMAYQVIKKMTEGLDFKEFDRRDKELLGAIVYLAGIVVWNRAQAGALPVKGYLPGEDFRQPELPTYQSVIPRCIVCGSDGHGGLPCPWPLPAGTVTLAPTLADFPCPRCGCFPCECTGVGQS